MSIWLFVDYYISMDAKMNVVKSYSYHIIIFILMNCKHAQNSCHLTKTCQN
jgi:hypothetical protein